MYHVYIVYDVEVLVVLCLCWIQTDADEEHAMPSG